MGAWGHQPFEDDSACDWAHDFVEVPDSGKLKFLADSLKFDYEGGEIAVAAAEVIAALLRRPCPQIAQPDAYTEEVAAWVAKAKVAVSPELQRAAREAVDAVLENSELAELWDDADEPEWRAATEDLRKRLS